MAYSVETKLAVIKMCQDGMPLRVIEREMGFDRKNIREWLRRYERFGKEGLKKRTYARTSYEIRCEAVRSFLSKEKSYMELADKYDVSRAQLKKWVARVKQEGYDSLREKRRGLPPKDERV